MKLYEIAFSFINCRKQNKTFISEYFRQLKSNISGCFSGQFITQICTLNSV